MSLAAGFVLFLVVFLWLAANAWLFERRLRHVRSMEEALEGTRELEETLDERLRQMDDYRHDLANLLQGLDPDLLREVSELGD